MTPMFRAEYAGIATDAANSPNAVQSTRAKKFFIASSFLFLTRQYSILLKLNRLRKETRPTQTGSFDFRFPLHHLPVGVNY
jgi:hypothetical protein